MIPDYNRLRVFYTVMTAGKVSAAAKALHVTQSAVSQHLTKLEAEIKTPLFTRLQNRLVPTDAGERLFAVITPFVHALDKTLEQLNRARSEPFGLLRIGAPVEFGVHFLPACFASFRQRYPDVQVVLELGHPEVLLPRLEQGRLDLVFTDLFSTHPGQHLKHDIFCFEPVMSETLILAVSQWYFKNSMRNRVDFETLKKADFIAYQPNAASLKSWFRHHFRKVPGQLNVAVTVESVQGVKASVLAGIGAGVLPGYLIVDEVDRKEIVALSHRPTALCNQIFLVYLLDKKPTLTEKTFMNHAKAEIIKTALAQQP